MTTHTITGTVAVLPKILSPQLGNTRDILVYLPPMYDTETQRYPVIYMQDGQNLFDEATSYSGEWRADETMEQLSRSGFPAIVVGIPNAGEQRLDEYSPFVDPEGGGQGDAYLAFVVETLKPQIDKRFRTLPDRVHTGILGSSMGGLISLYALFRYPNVFGFTGVMSPALWFAERAIFSFIERAQFAPGTIYMDVGHLEGDDELADVRRMCELLSAKGYRSGVDFLCIEDPGATHSETAWADRLDIALRFLLERARSAAPVVPQALWYTEQRGTWEKRCAA